MSRRHLAIALAAALLVFARADIPAVPAAHAAVAQGHRCVALARAHGGLVLVNRCRACRRVAVERRRLDTQRSRESFFISPVSVVPFPLRGAVDIRILEETTCGRTA